MKITSRFFRERFVESVFSRCVALLIIVYSDVHTNDYYSGLVAIILEEIEYQSSQSFVSKTLISRIIIIVIIIIILQIINVMKTRTHPFNDNSATPFYYKLQINFLLSILSIDNFVDSKLQSSAR